jgi:hypothetical protein
MARDTTVEMYVRTVSDTVSDINTDDGAIASVTVTVTVTGNLLNTKALTLVSRLLSQPVQSPTCEHKSIYIHTQNTYMHHSHNLHLL